MNIFSPKKSLFMILFAAIFVSGFLFSTMASACFSCLPVPSTPPTPPVPPKISIPITPYIPSIIPVIPTLPIPSIPSLPLIPPNLPVPPTPPTPPTPPCIFPCPEPPPSEPVCGNGILEEGEECEVGHECCDEGYICNTETCVCEEEEPPPVCNPELELVLNNGFEEPIVTSSYNWDIFDGSEILGWIINWSPEVPSEYNTYPRPINALLELQNNFNGWAAYEGNQYAELDSDWDGPEGSLTDEPASTVIYQDIATVPGQVYRVSFYFSPRPDTDAENNILELSWNGDIKATISAVGSSDVDWNEYEYYFEATGSLTRLQFADKGIPDSSGTFLDNISVRCWPGGEIPGCVDADGDGYYAYDEVECSIGNDCDDTNPSVNPGASEVCNNGIDDNCNGQVDENCNGGGGGGSSAVVVSGGGGGTPSPQEPEEEEEEEEVIEEEDVEVAGEKTEEEKEEIDTEGLGGMVGVGEEEEEEPCVCPDCPSCEEEGLLASVFGAFGSNCYDTLAWWFILIFALFALVKAILDWKKDKKAIVWLIWLAILLILAVVSYFLDYHQIDIWVFLVLGFLTLLLWAILSDRARKALIFFLGLIVLGIFLVIWLIKKCLLLWLLIVLLAVYFIISILLSLKKKKEDEPTIIERPEESF